LLGQRIERRRNRGLNLAPPQPRQHPASSFKAWTRNQPSSQIS
jgi:hypothetical protein